ncbi:MAG: 4-alpha-glucanotransferase [Bacteroidota bacterium]
MKIRFRIHFQTQWGQRLALSGNHPDLGHWNEDQLFPLQYRAGGFWEGEWDIPADTPETLAYKYALIYEDSGKVEWEFGANRKLEINIGRFNEIQVIDVWRSFWFEDNALYSSAFQRVLMARPDDAVQESAPSIKGSVYRFQIRAPRVGPKQKVCLLGNHPSLGNWDPEQVLLLSDKDYPVWSVDVPLQGPSVLVEYKYGIYDPETARILTWEVGENRTLTHVSTRKQKRLIVQSDESFRYPVGNWKAAGVAIPVFSLRSDKSGGIGEFSDLKGMVDWAVRTDLKMVQILPINDTTAKHSWLDSYPYSAISVFALHPLFLRMQKMGQLKDVDEQTRIDRERQRLNALPVVDYDGVLKLKWTFFRALYAEKRASIRRSKKFKAYIAANAEWLKPYAAFCALRDRYMTAETSQWPEHANYNEAAINAFVDPKADHYPEIEIHYWLQFHLHAQLQEAADYARKHGVVLKGDIPIGIYRHSVDAWVSPHLYNMSGQAGAPPDDFAVAGQNWGFPTYNWAEMAKDGYAWWRQRMAQMSDYFDAYRIDHILGFFRIWEIPWSATQGIMGQFNPVLPLTRDELAARGVWMDDERMTRPYIRQHFLEDFLGHNWQHATEQFLEEYQPGCFRFKAEYGSQRQVVDFIAAEIAKHPEAKSYYDSIEEGLLGLHAQVLFLEAPLSNGQAFSPRIALHFTRSFQELDGHTQEAINAIYNDFFYHRHESFWRDQAMVKLPAITAATDMLVCGEDLGMVPECVPGVMRELGLLSLEIQRMPKSPEQTFGHPADAPYLSVVSTSTHDMSTIRGWWEENPGRSQRFMNQVIGEGGNSPFYCEPWVARRIVDQHLYSPAMWAVLPWQDLMAIDPHLRRQNPLEEQINVPANSQHYWRYRMHLSLEELQEAKDFNAALRKMVRDAGRAEVY